MVYCRYALFIFLHVSGPRQGMETQTNLPCQRFMFWPIIAPVPVGIPLKIFGP